MKSHESSRVEGRGIAGFYDEGRGSWVASRSWEQSSADSQKWKHHFYNTEEMNSANKLNEQGNDYPPQHPERNPAPLTPWF